MINDHTHDNCRGANTLGLVQDAAGKAVFPLVTKQHCWTDAAKPVRINRRTDIASCGEPYGGVHRRCGQLYRQHPQCRRGPAAEQPLVEYTVVRLIFLQLICATYGTRRDLKSLLENDDAKAHSASAPWQASCNPRKMSAALNDAWETRKPEESQAGRTGHRDETFKEL